MVQDRAEFIDITLILMDTHRFHVHAYQLIRFVSLLYGLKNWTLNTQWHFWSIRLQYIWNTM